MRDDLDRLEDFKQYIYSQIRYANICAEDKEMLMLLAQNFISIYTEAVYESNGFRCL